MISCLLGNLALVSAALRGVPRVHRSLKKSDRPGVPAPSPPVVESAFGDVEDEAEGVGEFEETATQPDQGVDVVEYPSYEQPNSANSEAEWIEDKEDDNMAQELVRGLRTLQDKRNDLGPQHPEIASVDRRLLHDSAAGRRRPDASQTETVGASKILLNQ